MVIVNNQNFESLYQGAPGDLSDNVRHWDRSGFKVVVIPNKAGTVVFNNLLTSPPIPHGASGISLWKGRSVDITHFVKKLEWTSDGRYSEFDHRPVGADPLSISMTLDNRAHGLFDALTPGSVVMIKKRTPISATKASYTPYLTCYVWNRRKISNGKSDEIELDCKDRLFWLKLSEAVWKKDEMAQVKGKKANVVIKNLAKEFKFPLGTIKGLNVKLDSRCEIPTGGSVLDYIIHVLSFVRKHQRKKGKVPVSFDLHARNGKVNIVPVVKPKRLWKFTDGAMIESATFSQEFDESLFATQYILEQQITRKVKAKTGSKAGGNNKDGDFNKQNPLRRATIEVKVSGAASFWLNGLQSKRKDSGPHYIPYAGFKPVVRSNGEPFNITNSPEFQTYTKMAEVQGTPVYCFPNIPYSIVNGKPFALTFHGRIFKQGGRSYFDGSFYYWTFRRSSKPLGGAGEPFAGDIGTTENVFLPPSVLPDGIFKNPLDALGPEDKGFFETSILTPRSELPRFRLDDLEEEEEQTFLRGGQTVRAQIDDPITQASKLRTKHYKVGASGSRVATINFQYNALKADKVVKNLKIPDDPRFQNFTVTASYSDGRKTVHFKGIHSSLADFPLRPHILFTGEVIAVGSANFRSFVFRNGTFSVTDYPPPKPAKPPSSTTSTTNTSTGTASTPVTTTETVTVKHLINPTDKTIWKQYGIVRKAVPAYITEGVECKTFEGFAKQKKEARRHLDTEATQPDRRLQFSTRGVPNVWANKFIYVESRRMGVRGAFLVRHVTYRIEKGHIYMEIEVDVNLKSMLSDAAIIKLISKEPLRY